MHVVTPAVERIPVTWKSSFPWSGAVCPYNILEHFAVCVGSLVCMCVCVCVASVCMKYNSWLQLGFIVGLYKCLYSA